MTSPLPLRFLFMLVGSCQAPYPRRLLFVVIPLSCRIVLCVWVPFRPPTKLPRSLLDVACISISRLPDFSAAHVWVYIPCGSGHYQRAGLDCDHGELRFCCACGAWHSRAHNGFDLCRGWVLSCHVTDSGHDLDRCVRCCDQ